MRWTEDLCVNQTVSRVHENAAVLTESSGETPTAMPSSRCRVDGVEVMIEPWWRRDATFDSCTAEDHRGAPSLRPIIVKMPKHDAATAKSWMLQQPMVVSARRRRRGAAIRGCAARGVGRVRLFLPLAKELPCLLFGADRRQARGPSSV